METKHAKGYWEIQEDGTSVFIKNPAGKVITKITQKTGKDWFNKEESNAKLMAAAPKMLEALRSIQGIEAWIGDTKMRELFINRIYPAIKQATE